MTESVSIDSHGVYNRRKNTLGTNLLAVSLASCLFLTKQGSALTRLLTPNLALLVLLNTLDYRRVRRNDEIYPFRTFACTLLFKPSIDYR